MVNYSKQQALDVYLQGQFIGKLYSDNATLSFRYDSAYLENPNALKLSASLPLNATIFDHQITAAFFSGLLPDESVRQKLANYLGLSAKNTFALLKAIGGECAGAVSIYPEGITPQSNDTPTYRVLEDTEANEILISLNNRPFLAGTDNIRMSGAGAQDKLMIAFVNGKIAIPTGNTPSTHIIKPAINDLTETVQNEFFCMKLAKTIGLPVPEVNIFWLQNKPFYLVRRYDRKIENNGLTKRLHQEDFCQAMHIAPEIKYENEGGPTLLQCFGLLDEKIKTGCMAGRNKLTLLQGVIFNFFIGNGDAHGKNFSIIYEKEVESLAPFYDLLCTVIYTNNFKAKMAMKLGNEYRFKNITMNHWEQLATALKFRVDFTRRQLLIMQQNIASTALVLRNELNNNTTTASPIYEDIIAIITNNCKQIT